jgi:hypothetical protein
MMERDSFIYKQVLGATHTRVCPEVGTQSFSASRFLFLTTYHLLGKL